jgi:hypothetical protein
MSHTPISFTCHQYYTISAINSIVKYHTSLSFCLSVKFCLSKLQLKPTHKDANSKWWSSSPIQLPIQWVTGVILSGLKRPGRESDFHPLPSLRTSGSETDGTFSLNNSTSNLYTNFLPSISIGNCCKRALTNFDTQNLIYNSNLSILNPVASLAQNSKNKASEFLWASFHRQIFCYLRKFLLRLLYLWTGCLVYEVGQIGTDLRIDFRHSTHHINHRTPLESPGISM